VIPADRLIEMDITKLPALWHKTSRLPFGKWLFSKLIGRYVPYSGSIGAVVEELNAGFARVSLRDKHKIRNHLNSIHAVALMNLGEMASGLALNAGLPTNVRGIVTNMDIEFLKKARGTLVAECRCDIPDVVEDVQYIVKSEIVDKEGDKVANITVHWRLGLKKQEYGQYGQVCSFCQQ